MTDDSPPKPTRKRSTRRRGRGEDSLYQRASDGRWIVEIRDGYKPSGKPNIIYLTAKTKAAVMEKRRKVHEQMAHGVPVKAEQQTVGTYLACTSPTGFSTRSNLHEGPQPTTGMSRCARLTSSQRSVDGNSRS